MRVDDSFRSRGTQPLPTRGAKAKERPRIFHQLDAQLSQDPKALAVTIVIRPRRSQASATATILSWQRAFNRHRSPWPLECRERISFQSAPSRHFISFSEQLSSPLEETIISGYACDGLARQLPR